MIRIPVTTLQQAHGQRQAVYNPPAGARAAARAPSPGWVPAGHHKPIGSTHPGTGPLTYHHHQQQMASMARATMPAAANPATAPAKEIASKPVPAVVPRHSEPASTYAHSISRRMSYIEEDIQRSYHRLDSLPAKAAEANPSALQRDFELLSAQMASEVAMRKAAETKLHRVEAKLAQERTERAQRMATLKAGVEKMLAEIGQKCENQMRAEKEKLMKRAQKVEQMMQDVHKRLEKRVEGWVPIVLDIDGRDGSDSPGSTTPSTASFPSRPPSAVPTADGSSIGGHTLDPRPPSRDSMSKAGSRSRSKESVRPEAIRPEEGASAKLSKILSNAMQENRELMRKNRELVSKQGSKQSSLAQSRISPSGSQCVSPGGSSLLVGRPNFVPRAMQPPQSMMWSGDRVDSAERLPRY